MRVDWFVGCVTPSRLELFLRYLPEEPWPWVRSLTVITRPELELVTELLALASWRPDWNISVVSEERIAPPGPWPYTLEEYPLRFKLLFPLGHRPSGAKLWTDDDVVVLRDPGSLLGDRAWGGSGGLDSLREGNYLLPALGDVAARPRLTTAEFNAARTDCGVFYLPSLDHVTYRAALRRFFEDPEVARLHAREGHVRRFVNAYRTLDQRFMSAWIMRTGGHNHRAPVYRMLPYRKVPRTHKLRDGVFVHYAASGHKAEYEKWLHERADALGLPRLWEDEE